MNKLPKQLVKKEKRCLTADELLEMDGVKQVYYRPSVRRPSAGGYQKGGVKLATFLTEPVCFFNSFNNDWLNVLVTEDFF